MENVVNMAKLLSVNSVKNNGHRTIKKRKNNMIKNIEKIANKRLNNIVKTIKKE